MAAASGLMDLGQLLTSVDAPSIQLCGNDAFALLITRDTLAHMLDPKQVPGWWTPPGGIMAAPPAGDAGGAAAPADRAACFESPLPHAAARRALPAPKQPNTWLFCDDSTANVGSLITQVLQTSAGGKVVPALFDPRGMWRKCGKTCPWDPRKDGATPTPPEPLQGVVRCRASGSWVGRARLCSVAGLAKARPQMSILL
jgi:hypothetical protein